MALLELEDINGEIAEPIAGLVTTAYYARKSDFETIYDPKRMEDDDPNNVATTNEELMEINDTHVFKVGKCFKTIEFVQESAEFKSKTIGTKGGKLFENDLTLELAGSSSKNLGLLRALKNEKFIVLAEELGTGNMRQLGMSKYAATAESLEHTIAAVVEGKNDAKIIFKDKNFGPAPIYKGSILLTPQI